MSILKILPDRVMRDMAIHSMMVRQSHYINALFKELGEAKIKAGRKRKK